MVLFFCGHLFLIWILSDNFVKFFVFILKNKYPINSLNTNEEYGSRVSPFDCSTTIPFGRSQCMSGCGPCTEVITRRGDFVKVNKSHVS